MNEGIEVNSLKFVFLLKNRLERRKLLKKRLFGFLFKKRRRRDSNPWWSHPHNDFRGRHLKPLGHFSLRYYDNTRMIKFK